MILNWNLASVYFLAALVFEISGSLLPNANSYIVKLSISHQYILSFVENKEHITYYETGLHKCSKSKHGNWFLDQTGYYTKYSFYLLMRQQKHTFEN